MYGERSDSLVECLTLDRGEAGSSLTGVTELCPCARHINPSLVLVQPRKIVDGTKELNQTKPYMYEYTNIHVYCE